MSTTFPTLTVDIEPGSRSKKFKILDFTINPILQTEMRFPRVLSLPKSSFRVWVELVIGHNENQLQELPQITFSFNSAHKLNENDLSISDGPNFGLNSVNYRLYKHFWDSIVEDPTSQRILNDELVAAFGGGKRFLPASKPMIPGLVNPLAHRNAQFTSFCKGALAFSRRSVFTPKAYHRLNYPCTYQANVVFTDGKLDFNLTTLQTFSPFNHRPSASKVLIGNKESVSFWISYPFGESASIGAVNREFTQAFLQKVIFASQFQNNTLRVNYFPRIPNDRFAVENSSPPLSMTPPLINPPAVWNLQKFEPMDQFTTTDENSVLLGSNESGQVFTVEVCPQDSGATELQSFSSVVFPVKKKNRMNKSELTFMIQARDRKLESQRENTRFIAATFVALFLTMLSIVLSQEKWNGGTWVTLTAFFAVLLLVLYNTAKVSGVAPRIDTHSIRDTIRSLITSVLRRDQ